MTLRAHRAITPFWNRIPRFFLYPLQPRGLLVLLAVAVPLIALPLSFLGLLLRLPLLLGFIKYNLQVLAESSEGQLQPPPLGAVLASDGYSMPLKLFAIYIVLGTLQDVLARLTDSWLLLGLAGLLANLVLPAMIMVLAVSGSLLAALTPSTVSGLILRIGWPYLALYGLLTMLGSSVGGLLLLASQQLELQALVALGVVATLYIMVIAHHLMGYVVYQYQEALGYSTQPESDADPAQSDYQRFMQEQNYPAALQELRHLVNNRWDDLELHRRLHKLAALVPDRDLLLRHGQAFIPLLRQQKLIREATEVYRACQAVDPQFRPSEAEDYLPIAQMLRESRQPQAAIGLLNGFHRRFPASEQIPALYLLAARIFHEDLDNREQARRILRYCHSTFPQHHLHAAIERQLSLLDATA